MSDEKKTSPDPFKTKVTNDESDTVSLPTEPQPAAVNDPLIGQLLDGRYLIESKLDQGGMGAVYLAQHLKLMGKKVVVKVLLERALQEPDVLRKFEHEKESLIRVNHPNIVGVVDAGTLSDGKPYLVMEFVEGKSLRKLIKGSNSGQIPLESVIEIIESVGDALSVAHEQGIFHRDLKPENIMITTGAGGRSGHVKLIDFGIARVVNSKVAPETQVERGIGTIYYVAPEQLRGSLELTPACDIYSFGIVAYELLTGTIPFKPNSPYEMLQLQSKGVEIKPSTIRAGISGQAEDLILKALNYDPATRPQNAREFAHSLASELRHTGRSKQTGKVGGMKPGTESNLSRGAKDHTTAPTGFQSAQSITPPTEPAINETVAASVGGKVSDSATTMKSITPQVIHSKESRTNDSSAKKTVNKPAAEKSWYQQNPVLTGALAFILLLVIGAIATLLMWTVFFNKNNNKNSSASDPNAQGVPEASSKKSPSPQSSPAQTPATVSGNEFAYWMLVQKMKGDQSVGEPVRATAQDPLANSDKFQLFFKSNKGGYVYIFDEGKTDEGRTAYSILFPTPSRNSGKSMIDTNEMSTSMNSFGGKAGQETIWIIWTAEKNETLDAAREAAYSGDGEIKDAAAAEKLKTLLEFPRTNAPEVNNNSTNKETVLKTNSGMLIHKIELTHR